MGNKITLTYKYEKYVHNACLYTEYDVSKDKHEDSMLFKDGSYNALETVKGFIDEKKEYLDSIEEEFLHKRIINKIENNQKQLDDAYKRGTRNAPEIFLIENDEKDLRDKIINRDESIFDGEYLFCMRGIEGGWEYLDNDEKDVMWQYLTQLTLLAEELLGNEDSFKCEYHIYTTEEYEQLEMENEDDQNKNN